MLNSENFVKKQKWYTRVTVKIVHMQLYYTQHCNSYRKENLQIYGEHGKHRLEHLRKQIWEIGE